MTTAVAKCRGFTHPVIFLLRSTLKASCELSNSTVLIQGRCLQSARSRLNGRFFTTTTILRKIPGTAAKAKPSQPLAGATSSQNLPPYPPSYAQQLAQKPSATTLYEAAPQRSFVFSSYAAALFCMSVGGVNSWINVYNVPDGLPGWVPFAFGAVSFCMAVPATVFALRPAAVVRLIRVLPARPTKMSSGASKAHSAVPPVQLEITVRRHIPLPGLPLKRIKVEPHEVVMKARMYNPQTALSDYEKQQAKKAEEKRRKAEREYELNHLMTAPFRHALWAIRTIFVGLRRGLTGEGFAPIWIKGTQYKLPITDGYVLGDGRALDRIVRIEENTH
ncbi:hypothetical protein F5X99DRAFT_385989 [Biscogniauxia marginata]|nr:hypothetical protein F5X99DRAFT_385989 [Biscogniauxia marginata]